MLDVNLALGGLALLSGVKVFDTTKRTRHFWQVLWKFVVAGWTGIEPATSGVTGRRSNQLSYHPTCALASLRGVQYTKPDTALSSLARE